MKLATKKLFSLGLGGLLAFSMVGCGKTEAPTSTTPEPSTDTTQASASTEPSASAEDVVKPEKITMMVNGTFLDEASGQKDVVAAYKELTGIDLEITTIDHNSYNDQLSLAFASGDVPDVVILSAEYYAAYANQGALADISSYWESSETKASGRINETYIDSLYMDGALYGFTPARGNGCMTYLRQDWLDKLGLSVPTTYDEYINVLRAFVNNDPDGNGKNDTMGVTAAGIMSSEAPFTNYLPEFWQDAYPDFYQKEDGSWVDGFSEQATADALQRLKDAYSEGLIDMEVTTNKTSSCRDKYYAGQVGAFTYWAGKWSATIDENLKQVNPTGSIVGIAPIKELGQYVERQSPVVAITNKCENPAGVFKYLFEVMVDGDKGQTIFNYGAEGVHYTLDNGKMTLLPDPEVPTSTFTNIFVDPLIGISTWTNGDPMADARNPLVKETNELFMNNSKVAPVIVSNDTMSNYSATLLDIRTVIVTDVVTGDLTVEQGMASYKEQSAAMVDEILASLN